MARVDAFYDALADQYGYDQPSDSVAEIPREHVERRYALVDNPDAVFDDALDRLFFASAGMSGPPHLGTLSQIHAVRELADAGLDVEFLLADLEKYLGSGMSMEYVTDLADRYRGLARELGYTGDIRTQAGDREVMHAAMLLSRYYETDLLPDFEWESTEWDEALDRAYEADGVDRSDGEPVTEFARTQTGALCTADFLHPLMSEGYDAFVAVLGAEEHALTLRNREMKRRAGVEGQIGGLYTKVVRGLEDYLKMSKRIPPSVDETQASRPPIRNLRFLMTSSAWTCGRTRSDSASGAPATTDSGSSSPSRPSTLRVNSTTANAQETKTENAGMPRGRRTPISSPNSPRTGSSLLRAECNPRPKRGDSSHVSSIQLI